MSFRSFFIRITTDCILVSRLCGGGQTKEAYKITPQFLQDC